MAKDEDLYTEHAKNVYRYLFSLSGEADTAEELTQETFYRALKSLDSYRGEASPQVWLCAIAKRLWFKELERGINGRYRPLSTTYSPLQRTAGVSCINNSDKGIYMLAAYNCRGIYSAELTFHVYYRDLVKTAVMTVGIDSPDFLKIYSAAEFANELGVDTDGMESIAPFGLRDVKLLDESGNDVTAQYTDESVEQNWAGGPSAAETGAVYVFMAIVAVLGIILVRFFLRRN